MKRGLSLDLPYREKQLHSARPIGYWQKHVVAHVDRVAGLFLREITKLKFGAVELEKASMAQVSVSTSLNITR